MLSKNKFTDYTIFEFLDDKSLLSLLAINKQFNQQDDYFKYRLSQIYNLPLAMAKPNDKTYRQWWQILISNKISLQNPTQLLKFATKNDFFALFEYALTYKINLDLALIFVSEYGNLPMVKCLTQAGANPKYMYSAGLRKAARGGHLDIIKYLAELGANTRDYEDEALRSAILSGNADLVQYLISNGSIITVSMFEIIIDLNRSDILSNNIDKLSSDTLLGLLMYAINVNNLKMVNYMFEADFTRDLDKPMILTCAINQHINRTESRWREYLNFYFQLATKYVCDLGVFLNNIIENYAIDYTRLCAQTASQLINFALSHEIDVKPAITKLLYYSLDQLDLFLLLVEYGADIRADIGVLIEKARS